MKTTFCTLPSVAGALLPLLAFATGCANVSRSQRIAPVPASVESTASTAADSDAVGGPEHADATAADATATKIVDAAMSVREGRESTPATGSAVSAQDTPRRQDGLSSVELGIWRDPEFQRRFTESYLAETAVEPPVTPNELEVLQEMRELMAKDKPEEALALLESERRDTSNAVFDVEIANLYFQRDKLEEAAAAAHAAIEKYPRYRRAWQLLGFVHIKRSEFEGAATAFTKVIEGGGGNAMAFGFLGLARMSLNQMIEAEAAYRMAMLLDPKTFEWKSGLGESLRKQRRYPEVIALCDSLIQADPSRMQPWAMQAEAYLGLGQFENAAENFELIDRMGQATPDMLNRLGTIYVRNGTADLAVPSFLRAIEMNPESPLGPAMDAAEFIARSDDRESARALVDGIERLRGDKLDDAARKKLLWTRARIAAAESASADEIRILEQISQLDPRDGQALIKLGQIAQNQGDSDRAVFYFERAESIEAFEADAKVQRAQLLVRQSKFAEAVALLKQAQSVKPRDNVQNYLEKIEKLAQGR